MLQMFSSYGFQRRWASLRQHRLASNQVTKGEYPLPLPRHQRCLGRSAQLSVAAERAQLAPHQLLMKRRQLFHLLKLARLLSYLAVQLKAQNPFHATTWVLGPIKMDTLVIARCIAVLNFILNSVYLFSSAASLQFFYSILQTPVRR